MSRDAINASHIHVVQIHEVGKENYHHLGYLLELPVDVLLPQILGARLFVCLFVYSLVVSFV